MTEKSCVMCANPLSKPRSGPWPRYCGSGCKQAARRAARRLDAALGALEDRERWHREQSKFGTGTPAHHLALAEHLRGEIATAEARMSALLDAGDDGA